MSSREMRRLKSKVDDISDAVELLIKSELEWLHSLQESKIGTIDYSPTPIVEIARKREKQRSSMIRKLENILRKL